MRLEERIQGSKWACPVVLAGLIAFSLPVLAQSGEEMDDVTMEMVTDEDELSGEMMREIELNAPAEMESGEGFESTDDVDELESGVMEETEDLQNDFSEDVIPGSDDELSDEVGDVEETLVDEEDNISAPIDDAIDDDDTLDDTTDDLEDTVDDTEDDLEDGTEDTSEELDDTLDP